MSPEDTKQPNAKVTKRNFPQRSYWLTSNCDPAHVVSLLVRLQKGGPRWELFVPWLVELFCLAGSFVKTDISATRGRAPSVRHVLFTSRLDYYSTAQLNISQRFVSCFVLLCVFLRKLHALVEPCFHLKCSGEMTVLGYDYCLLQ